MNTSVNNNNIESNNGMSQVINILTGETKKIRCHYISSRTDKPVSRVLTLERLSHPALTAAGVTAWAERFNDGVNSFDWLRVSIQLTDKICYTPNCANVGLPDVENYGNLDYYKNQESAMRVYMNNVDKFFQSIADKPAKMMTGEDWPNMAVIAAYRATGRDEEADTLTAARDIYEARREAKNEAWRKEWEEKKRKEQEKQNSFAEGMRVRVPAASLERNRDKEAFVITRIRRKAADNGGNASLTVKSELTGMERDINGSDVSEILPALQEASEITEFFTKGKKYRCIKSVKGDFTKGKIYEQSSDPTQWYGYFRNDKGIHHVWPQPAQIDHNCELYDMKPEDIDPRLYFEPVEEITEAEGIKVGDRVWCKHGEVMGTVTAIRIWNPDYAFKVRLDKPVTLFGRTFEETEFRRAGITKNYDRDGMIVGNAQYYAEQLKYGPASIIEYELAGVALRTESTREDVEPDRREGWGNEYRVTIHHQTGDTTETMTLSEAAELLARMYQEEQGKA